MARVGIKYDSDRLYYAQVTVDGEAVERVTGYTIEHNAQEIPSIELRFCNIDDIDCPEMIVCFSDKTVELFAKNITHGQYDIFEKAYKDRYKK